MLGNIKFMICRFYVVDVIRKYMDLIGIKNKRINNYKNIKDMKDIYKVLCESMYEFVKEHVNEVTEKKDIFGHDVT